MKYLSNPIPGAWRVLSAFGLAPRDQREFLLKMLPRHSVGAEIGVHKGDFSKRILQTVKPRKLHLIDPWKHERSEIYKDAWYGGKTPGGQAEMERRYEAVLERFCKARASGQVEVHRGASQEVSRIFSDEYFDWVYIDGNHLYEYVKSDLEHYCKKVKRGGYLMGDDYGQDGWWAGGVTKAVDEFALSDGVELVRIKNSQFILRRIER